MKYRSDFVSNSSTTVFTIKIDSEKNSAGNVQKIVDDLGETYRRLMTKENIDPGKYEEAVKYYNLEHFPVDIQPGCTPNTVDVVVPINFGHVADYLRTFLVNIFNAQEDEIF